MRTPTSARSRTEDCARALTIFSSRSRSDRRLAVGLLTCYRLIVPEDFTVTDSSPPKASHSMVTTNPIRIEKSIQAFGIEDNAELYAVLFRTQYKDKGTSDATRFELGSIA